MPAAIPAPVTTGTPALRVLLVAANGSPAVATLAGTRGGGGAELIIERVLGIEAALARLGDGQIDRVDVVALNLGPDATAAAAAVRCLRDAAPAVAIVGLARGEVPGLAARVFLDGAEDLVVLDEAGRAQLARSLGQAVERHRIHAALRLQAEQHQAIVEGSIQGLVIHQDGVVRYANPALARLLGYDSPAQLIGQAVASLLPLHERERLAAMGAARRRGEAVPTRYEHHGLRRDGSLVQVECVVTPIEWQGRPATISTMLDVTERGRAEAGMRALAEIGRELVGLVGLREAGAAIVGRVRELFGARLASLYHLGPDPDVLTCVAAAGGRTPAEWIGLRIRVGEGLTGLAVAQGEPVWAPDIATDPRVVVSETLQPFMVSEGYRSGVAMPLHIGSQAVGALFLGDPPGDDFGPERMGLLLSFADRAALAVERTALHERSAERAEKLAVLAHVSGLIASATDSSRVLEAVARAAISLLGATAAGVLVDDPLAGVLRAGPHFRSDVDWNPLGLIVVPYGRGVASEVFLLRAPVFVEDSYTDPRWHNKAWIEAQGLHGYAGLPLLARDRAIGVLSIFFAETRVFGDEERELMELLAQQAAIALDNARLLQETERRRRTAEALAEMARLASQSLDTADIAARITESVQGLLAVTNAALFRFRPDTNDLESLSLIGDHGPTGGKAIVYPVGSGAAGLAVLDRRPVVTSDLLADPRIVQPPEQRARMERAAFRAVLAVPLLVPGRVVGVLVLGDRVGRQFTEEEVQIAEAFADRAAVALEAARLYAEVRDARDFLRSIAESSVDAIVTCDVGGAITYWSPGAEEILGYSPVAILGEPAARLYAGGVEEARAVMGRLRREGRLRDYETTALASDGRALSVSASLALLRDASGGITGTVAVVKDVTERKTLEASFRQAQKMEAVGQLAGGIAHDFNNLMTVVSGRAELLLARLRPEDPVRRDVELFRATADRAAALTRQLLAFSRKQVLQPKVLDLNTVVENLEPMLERLIGEDVDLRTALGERLGRVVADPGQLEQVLVNLVVNARDAMPEGGKLTIETADVDLDAAYARRHPGMRPGPHVLLAVSDTGTGMDAATRARVFEPFFTTKGTGKGTGLGLSTVYGIVKQSGGSVWVYSELGTGTTFKIYLPRVEETAEDGEVDTAPPVLASGSETVLLVEDEDEVRAVAREALEATGYTVLEARHGTEALLIAERHAGPIHLLLTDVVMPGMNGAELARRLSPLRPETVVLFVSGYTDEAIVHHGVLDPGTAFLEKPFTLDRLSRKIREVLGSATTR